MFDSEVGCFGKDFFSIMEVPWATAYYDLFVECVYIAPEISHVYSGVHFNLMCIILAAGGDRHQTTRGHDLTVSGLILGLRSANERRRYFITTSLMGWVQALNQPCCLFAGDLNWLWDSGPRFNTDRLSVYVISEIKIRLIWDRLIFIIGIQYW